MRAIHYNDKVFVTGVYGSGKTYYAQNIVRRTDSHTYISFDKNFNYRTQSLGPLYKKINEHDKFVIDAIPCLVGWSGPGDWEASSSWLKKFSSEHPCTVVLVKCELEAWLARLPKKRMKAKGRAGHINSYNLFYEGGGLTNALRPFGDRIDLIVSHSDKEK